MVATQAGKCLETTTTTAGLRCGLYQNRVIHIKKRTEEIILFPPQLPEGVRTPGGGLSGHSGTTGDLADACCVAF